MKITSDFLHEDKIPPLYTCEGKNISPPLTFSQVPKEAKSLVVIMDDPDVPAAVRADQMYDHWVVFNIPPTTHTIEAGSTPPGIEGNNTSGKRGYTGPCPPAQYNPTEHRYYFKLYALDTLLHLKEGASKKEVELAMKGHIIAESNLIGRFEKRFR